MAPVYLAGCIHAPLTNTRTNPCARTDSAEPSGVANTSQDVDEDDDGADDGGEGDGDETEGMDDDALEVCRAWGGREWVPGLVVEGLGGDV